MFLHIYFGVLTAMGNHFLYVQFTHLTELSTEWQIFKGVYFDPGWSVLQFDKMYR